ncbi:MAG: hypothetical protein JO355_01975 [Planctomycetaceae bacterium]|nr:hypothetical protein [Planctomycetaceae bacterium]MBV8609083.1 hypothetical protein [Singulisphaera sp.]MBV8268136.1 hypothetical protein [Planctomycetaceae bacterium]MBV8318795.1 hypothetical protein [Planctomycetaceae bacterium]MBV8381054.1 hypothetical protein [Planctomycetaceae bacterium]
MGYVIGFLLAVAVLVASRFLVGPGRLIAKRAIWRHTIAGVSLLFALLMVAGTSLVHVGEDQVGHIFKIYGSKSLAVGRIVAINGENGPQADVLPPGFHFIPLINITSDVSMKEVVKVPDGQYAYLVALDGEPLRPNQALADAFNPKDQESMVNDARYFLAHHGQKGPQTTVLTPGTYRLNRYLWDVNVKGTVTEIKAGEVGVIKSNVKSPVQFGNLDSTLLGTKEKPTGVPEKDTGRLAVPLVRVGEVGLWDTALNPGRYYLNDKAYQVVIVDTKVQTMIYRGGFTKRNIALQVDQKGQITQVETQEVVDMPPGAADRAVLVKVESWDIPQELRVEIQVAPADAPFVVGSVGGLEQVERNILTPVIRSMTRDVTGGGSIVVEEERVSKDASGQENRTPVKVRRRIQALDLISNRSAIEEQLLEPLQREGRKAGVAIREIRLGDSAIPPELLLGTQREQLATQMKRAFEQEKISQERRTEAEQARASAEQQPELVHAQIEVQRSESLRKARENEGMGERRKLEEIAKGQKAQVDVLGPDKVVQLRRFELALERVLDFLDKHPDTLTAALGAAHKFVPERVITVGAGGKGLTGPAAVLGELLSPSDRPIAEKK